MTIKLHHALLGFLVFALATSLVRNSAVILNNVPFYNQLKSDYEKEKDKNNELKLNVIKSKDPFEIEKLLRNKLGFVKANEQIIIIPDISPTVTPTSTGVPLD